ncbi:MAG TPA: hypothetical protein VJN89_21675 [Candidatus Acidoferrum sp.]|nr:hypothetical protein [Candidatus Acidoferrum sp.]
MEARFAFTAQYWGNSAVVCRAIEDRPGPIVEPQFGEFQSWTQAQNFAAKLNEGLDLAPFEVRRIVTSSLLAAACVLKETLKCRQLWNNMRSETRATQLRFVLAGLTLALTFCRSASLLSNPSRRALLNARETFHHASRFLNLHGAESRELQEIAARTRTLDAALQALALSLRPSSSPPDEC